MTTITIDDELQSRFQAVAAPEEDVIALAKAAMTEFIARREQEAIARAEAQAHLSGPSRPFAEADAAFRHRHGLPEYTPLSADKRADEAERVIAAMEPQVRQELERDGWL